MVRWGLLNENKSKRDCEEGQNERRKTNEKKKSKRLSNRKETGVM